MRLVRDGPSSAALLCSNLLLQIRKLHRLKRQAHCRARSPYVDLPQDITWWHCISVMCRLSFVVVMYCTRRCAQLDVLAGCAEQGNDVNAC